MSGFTSKRELPGTIETGFLITRFHVQHLDLY